MEVNFHNTRDSFELLPSIMIQRCLGHIFVYVAWGTATLEIQIK